MPTEERVSTFGRPTLIEQLDSLPLDASPLDASPLDASPLDASLLDASSSPLALGQPLVASNNTDARQCRRVSMGNPYH